MAKQGYSLYSPSAWLKRKLYRRSRSNRAFAGITATLVVLKLLRRGLSRKPEVVAIDKLRIGQSMTVTLLERPSRKQKKAAREAGTSA
jgi:hypothetical protein